ncbi:CvfD/Ygs/GSP13 family RNA-binding post-transcriptional regulator [Levilactobacillus bambusae]|uniref:General stress protein n=1 Tax=Levilactobacillus bambusae TaxID=2024736 RepID=A0A2V1MXR3_9LACO|nr:CvfD/Ygs/GSP13 family RNA-binding post-transcriptional regulator [Levilactobacillus bambusae]PWF99621.1 general stress protein [Levilactobacillus bambusae]
MTSYQIGMRVHGRITGIQPYGAFVDLGDHQQGLIHISECHQGFVRDIHDYLSVNQEIDVIILDIDEYSGKISLSLRCLEEQGEPGKPVNLTHKHYWTNRNVNIGFTPIANQLDGWRKKAYQTFVTQN